MAAPEARIKGNKSSFPIREAVKFFADWLNTATLTIQPTRLTTANLPKIADLALLLPLPGLVAL